MEDFAALDLPALSLFTESRNSGQSALALVPELRAGKVSVPGELSALGG
jgi:hypothetical protein